VVLLNRTLTSRASFCSGEPLIYWWWCVSMNCEQTDNMLGHMYQLESMVKFRVDQLSIL
jgi:hypothetical protein